MMPPLDMVSIYYDALANGIYDKGDFTYSCVSSKKGNFEMEITTTRDDDVGKIGFKYDNYYLTETSDYSKTDGVETSSLTNCKPNVCELEYPSIDDTWSKVD